MLGVSALAALAAVQTILVYQAGPLVAGGIFLAVGLGLVICWRPLVGVGAGMLAIPLELQDLQLGAVGITPAEGILLVTACAAAGHYLYRGRTVSMPSAFIGFAGLTLVAAMGAVFADDSFVVAKIALMWTTFLAVALLVADAEVPQVERVLVCVALTGGVVGLIAAITSGDQQVVEGGARVTGRATASFAHPTVLASVLVLSIPIALVLVFRGSGARRALMALAALAGSAGLVLTLTRSGIVAAAISMVVLLWWAPFRRVALALLLVLAVAVIVSPDASRRSAQVSVVGQRLGTLTGEEVGRNPRIAIWSVTERIIADRPLLGVGEGNFPGASSARGLIDVGGVPYDHAHNVFLTIAAETGILGLVFFLAFLGGTVQAGVRALRARTAEHYPLALAIVASLVGLLVVSLTEYPRTNVLMATLLVVIGALVALARREGSGPAPTHRLRHGHGQSRAQR